MEESLYITNRFGEKLEALLRKPEGLGPFPAVVSVSGFGMDLHEYKNSFDEISQHLVKSGFLTLQFSFAGRGRSEGDYTQMTLERQADQLQDVIVWLGKRNDVKAKRIGILAQSFGCPTTMVYLTKEDLVKGVCLVSGVYFLKTRFPKKAEEQKVIIHKDDVTLFLDPFDNEIPVGPDFWKSIEAFDPIAILKNITIPTLMIHGGKDKYITTGAVQTVFDALKSKQKKLKAFSGGDHGITDVPRKMREEFLSDIVQWFKSAL